MKKIIITTLAILTLLLSTTSFAGSGRYEAIWNGKSFLIVDSEDGHIWTFRGDTMIYNGQVDGNDFEPPLSSQIWQLKHGKWTKH
ncbi:MAG: hypothetical protein ISR69_07265 [Gammaproteobacteria bacterium]|nr:hypothetical protein [Gammaproteobacteria bacterium]